MTVEFNFKKRPYTLSVDVDNTIADYSGGVKDYIIDNNPGLSESDFPPLSDYCFVKSKWPTLATLQDYQATHVNAAEEMFLANLRTYTGAVEALETLHDNGVFIRIVTHRLFARGIHRKSVDSTALWLDKNNIPYDELCFSGRKSDIVSDALIDDSMSNINEWRDVHGNGDNPRRPAFIFDQPYNRDYSHDPFYVLNWEDGLDKILAHKERIGK